MPLDLVRRLLTPLRDPVPTSRYPEAAPLLQFATRGLPEIVLGAGCDRELVLAPVARARIDMSHGKAATPVGAAQREAAAQIAEVA